MLKRLLTAVIAVALIAAPVASAYAQAAATDKAKTEKPRTQKAKTEKVAKPLTPQQQKMKDCAAKWSDEKAAKKVSGRAAHNKFMSGCLKGST